MQATVIAASRTKFAKFVPAWATLHTTPFHINNWYRAKGRKCTIIIPSYNDFGVLSKCLKSLKRTTDNSMVDILVVDDCSKPDHRSKLASLEGGRVKVILRPVNGGFAKAVNTGMEAVKTGDVILINSDIIARPGWLEALQYGAYAYDKKAGIVGAKLLYDDGTIQYAGTYRNLGSPDWFDHLYRFKPSNYGPANVPGYVTAITGACMYIKRQVIKTIGYMDENFGMAFEDVDYSLRAWQAGFRNLYFPLATLTHLEGATRGKVQGPRELASQEYFWKKWRKWFDHRNVKDSRGRVRIIYVIQSTGVGGGARMVFEHLNRLAESGYNIELYTLDKTPDWFDLKVPVRSFRRYEDLIPALEKQAAIKVATWWETANAVWLASVSKGIAAYYVQDIETSYYQGNAMGQNVVLSFYKPEFRYMTISGWNQQKLAELGLSSTVVGCGIDSQTFKQLPNTKREKDVLVAVGRGHYLKNLALTISGWRALPQSLRPRLWLYGIDPHLANGLPNATYYKKPTDQKINQLLNQATIFAQTSLHEGFCLTVVEAMAAGLPVITTDSDGNRDFCRPGVNCLMIEQNSVPQMRQALARLLGDSELQNKLRQEGLKTAARYDWPMVIERVKAFYGQVVPK